MTRGTFDRFATLSMLTAAGLEVFTYANALDIGISAAQLRSLIASGDAVRVRRGVYAVCNFDLDFTELKQSADLIRKTVVGAVLSHESAAQLHGLPCLDSYRKYKDNGRLTITTPHGAHLGRNGYRTVSADLPPSQITEVEGIKVTSLMRTAVDIARMGNFRCGLAVFDAVFRRIIEKENPESDLRESAALSEVTSDLRRQAKTITDDMRRWPGVAKARRCIDLANPAAESVLESASRANVIEAGLPIPKLGVPIFAEGSLYYVDMLWEKQRVIGEADGAIKYMSGDPRVLLAEKHREDSLRRKGFAMVRWNWEEAIKHPERMIQRLMSYLPYSIRDFATVI